MKRHGLCSSILLLVVSLIPLTAIAAWQVATPVSAEPPSREPFFQAGAEHRPAITHAPYGHARYPNEYANFGSPTPIYAVSISGSLKQNIERIMRRYNWKVVWKAPYDYNFDGKVTGSSLPNVIQKVLQPFPLQAVMYMSNRTVAVVPRQIR